MHTTQYFENFEGYDPGDAEAEQILDIPESFPAETGWPSEELLREVGAKFLLNDHTRVVEIAGRKFCEGLLEANINEIEESQTNWNDVERVSEDAIRYKNRNGRFIEQKP